MRVARALPCRTGELLHAILTDMQARPTAFFRAFLQVGDKAQEAAAITKSTTEAAADVTKQALDGAARKAGRALETKEARRK